MIHYRMYTLKTQSLVATINTTATYIELSATEFLTNQFNHYISIKLVAVYQSNFHLDEQIIVPWTAIIYFVFFTVLLVESYYCTMVEPPSITILTISFHSTIATTVLVVISVLGCKLHAIQSTASTIIEWINRIYSLILWYL